MVATAAAATATAAVAHRRAAAAATAPAATTDTAATQQPQQPHGSHSNCSSHSCHRKTKETTTVKRGHDEPREVKNSSCKQCTKDRFPFLSSSGFRGGAPFAFKNHQFLQNSLKSFKIDYRSVTALFLLIKNDQNRLPLLQKCVSEANYWPSTVQESRPYFIHIIRLSVFNENMESKYHSLSSVFLIHFASEGPKGAPKECTEATGGP